ncbi:EamA family transporter [Flavobacterium sp.]|uniref:EamA family transporter n=1 Tax=Flavobacterium sp. TaxID=239 RepID=UPI003264B286
MIAKILLILATVSVTSVSQVLLKLGMRNFVMEQFDIMVIIKQLFSPLVFFGLGLYAVSALLWLYILSKVDLTFAYPFISLGFIIVMLAGYFFLGEKIGALRLFGFMFIVSGVILIAFSQK